MSELSAPVSAPGRVERIISVLLRVGVMTSLTLLIVGTFISFVVSGRYGGTPDDLQRLITASGDFPHTVDWLVAGLRELRGQAMIVLGLVLLLVTPVLRVLVSMVAFAAERDWAFVFIALIVLALLTVPPLLT